MPFKSEKQRKWMWANDPEMAKKWEKEEKMKKETKVRKLIRKMVSEILSEQGVSTLGSVSGAKLPGFKSQTTIQREKDVKQANLEYQTHLASEPGKYVWLAPSKPSKPVGPVVGKPVVGKPVLQTGNEPPKGVKSTKNPLWTKWDSLTGELKKALGDAQSGLDTSQTADSQETVPTEKPPTGVGLGVTKGKGKKKRDDIEEAKKRDYKAEYKKYGASKKAKKYRAELNKYNRQKGTYGNGDKLDASHKNGKIVGFEEQSKNRGRAEKSRLKKEQTVKLSTMKDANFEPGQFVQILGKKGKVKLDKNSVKFLAKWIRQNSGKHGMGWSFTEGKLNEAKTLTLPNGVKAKIDFKGVTFISKLSKPVFLDRDELLKFFRGSTKYLRYEGKLTEMNEPWFEITYKDSRGRTKTDSMRAKNPKEAKKDFVNLMKGRGFKVLKVVKEGKLKESGIMYKAGVKKYGKEGMKKIQQAAGQKKSHAEIGAIKDKYEKGKKKDEGKINERMDKRKAATILKQIGGNKFIAMTGAKGFAFSDKYMSFKIGRNSKGINFVRIGHNAKDLYDLEFGFVSVKGIKVKKKVKDVYADMLGTMFEKYTGMRTSL